MKTRLFFALPFLLFFACSEGVSAPENGEKPLLVLSIMPYEYFASRIAGNTVNTVTLAGPGVNPHSYEPSPRQMFQLAKAEAWVLSGAEFEIGLEPKIARLFPKLEILDCTQGMTFRSLEEHDDEDGDHHEDDDLDRHTWLGRENAKIIAQKLCDLFVSLNSDESDFYRKNRDDLLNDIDAVFDRYKSELSALAGTTVYVYHPSFGYFLDEFGIEQKAIESGGKEPTPRRLAALIEDARKEKVKTIFVQAQFPAEAAKTAAKGAGAEVVSLDPLAADWLANIETMGGALKKTLSEEASL